VRGRALEAAAAAGLLAVAGWLFAGTLDTAANFDEGVYLASLDALRHGQELGRDVFPDQPPGFYLLLQGSAAVFGNTVHDVRLGLLCFSLLAVAAAYACGRALGGRGGGLGAAALLVVATPWPSYAALVEADPPAVVLSLVALALAARAYGARERPALAFLAGAAVVAAISMKLLALTTLVPLAAFAVAGRASRRTVAATLAGGAAVVLALVAIYAGSLHELWTGIVDVHRQARGVSGGGTSNGSRVLHFLDLHTPFGWAAPAGIVASAALAARRVGGLRLWPLWTWTAASVALLLFQKPLLDHHLVLLAAALALPCGTALGAAAAALPRPLAAAAAAAGLALLAAGLFQEHRRLARDREPEPAGVTWAASRLAAETLSDDLVSTDLPIVAYLADRRIPGQLIDTSVGRLGSGFLRPGEVLRLIGTSGVRAVVVGRLFQDYPAIVAGIRARYPRTERRDGVTLYLPRRVP
jgi:4-amino-4-deoxy-L-arabinose transferase-like glycosyltransferase